MSIQKTAEEIAQELADMRARVVYCYKNHNNLEQEAERLRKALEKLTNEASGFLAMADVATHGITNINVLLVRISEARAALAPQPTEAQEPTLEQLEREYIEACVRANLGPSSECEARSAECSARWEALRAKRRAIDAARKEAGEKPK